MARSTDCSSCRAVRAFPGRRRVAPPTTRRRRRNGVCSPRCSPTCRSSSTLIPATSTPSARRRALVAIRQRWEQSDEALSFALLIEALGGHPCLETILKAQRYAEDLAFEADAARASSSMRLQIDLRHRKLELDRLRGRLSSKEDLVAFQEKNLAYKRLQGALPSA